MILIGLTGGIASGKSTVSSIFSKEYGIPVVDADLIARKVVEPNTKGWMRVIKLFGDSILNQDQSINREKLGEIIFSDHSKRKKLNKCLHGLILFEMIKEIFFILIKGNRYVILDVPLLFDVKIGLWFLSYKLVVVCNDEHEQITRLMKRNPNFTESDAKRRLYSQITNQERMKLADYVIDNTNELTYTRKQCDHLNKIFKSSKKYLYFRFAISILLFGGFYILSKFLF
jgi:dephospho-CoA kinase